jgi:hypothetical protein
MCRDGQLPAGQDQVGVAEVAPSGLHGVLGCLEDLGVLGRVPKLLLGNLGQGVAALHGHPVALCVVAFGLWRDGYLEDLSDAEESGVGSKDVLVQFG